MATKEKMYRLNVEITRSQLEKIKILSALKHQKIREYVLSKVFNEEESLLNNETKAALEDVENKLNLTKHASSKALFDKYR